MYPMQVQHVHWITQSQATLIEVNDTDIIVLHPLLRGSHAEIRAQELDGLESVHTFLLAGQHKKNARSTVGTATYRKNFYDFWQKLAHFFHPP